MNIEFASNERSIARLLSERQAALIPARHGNILATVAEGWSRFLALPHEERIKLLIAGQQDPDWGLVIKRGEPAPDTGIPHDKKAYFHYSPRLLDMYAKAGLDYSAHVGWLQDCNELYHRVATDVIEIMAEIDRVYPGSNLEARAREKYRDGTSKLRLLDYKEDAAAGDSLAQGHIDKCAITAHLWENQPGLHLRFGGESSPLVPYDVIPTQTLVFPSRTLAEERSDAFRGLWHCALASSQAPQGERRRVIVYFAHICDPKT